jgi:hypothetical protein
LFFFASFQWQKECLDFIGRLREKVETMGFDRKKYYTQVRPTLVEVKVFLRAETKKEDGGRFEGMAY